MPVTAELAAVSATLALNPGEQGGIERITLGAITALAGAAVLELFLGRLFHGGRTGD